MDSNKEPLEPLLTEEPVDTRTEPLSPDTDVPVDTSTDPLEPFTTFDAELEMVTEPDTEPSPPEPLINFTSPPVLSTVEPIEDPALIVT